jgi:hypothetical protein
MYPECTALNLVPVHVHGTAVVQSTSKLGRLHRLLQTAGTTKFISTDDVLFIVLYMYGT